MKHLGDITKINGADVPAVNVVIGGSPCQDLSIAGTQKGFDGERSVLFMDQIRVIKEMRAKYGKPRFMVWENVPGAFSSNRGADFAAVLTETIRIVDTQAPLFLSLKTGGLQSGASQEMEYTENGVLLGEYSMRSFGESPNAAVESHLSQILEDQPHPKYFLSARACAGILQRADRRGKPLPPLLRAALQQQSTTEVHFTVTKQKL